MNQQFIDKLNELKIAPLGISFCNFLKIGPNKASLPRNKTVGV